jgi:exonuclease V
MASDAESDGFGAFDFGEFTADDFEEIDRDVATKLVEPSFTTFFGLAGGHTTTSGDLSSSSSSSGSSDEHENDHSRGPERPHGQGQDYASESFEFDASLDLNNLAEEDFLAIDDAVKLLSNLPVTREDPMSLIPAPAILDTPRIDPPENGGPVAKPRWRYNGRKNAGKLWKDKSLLERHKPAGILSVTDLVSPTWCVPPLILITADAHVLYPIIYVNPNRLLHYELPRRVINRCEVQIDYGLRQKRWMPVAKRPKSFKTESGKEITVEVKVAEQNDVRTKQGQVSFHCQLHLL